MLSLNTSAPRAEAQVFGTRCGHVGRTHRQREAQQENIGRGKHNREAKKNKAPASEREIDVWREARESGED